MIPALLIAAGLGLVGYKLWGQKSAAGSTPAPAPTPSAASKFKAGDYALAIKGGIVSPDNVAPVKLRSLDAMGWICESLESPGRVMTVYEKDLRGPVGSEGDLMALYAKTLGLPANFSI